MPWSNRKNGNRYYYRNYWQYGRQHQKYIDTGSAAELAATEHLERNLAKQTDHKTVNKWCHKLAITDDFVSLSSTIQNRLLTAGLLTAGFYQQDRHAWTKRQYNRRCCSSPSKNSAA